MATKKQYPEEEVVREEAKPDPVRPHPAGIRRALVLFVVLGAASLVPYAHPSLAEFRPWSEGSKIPFTTLFDFRAPTRPRLAGVQEREASSKRSAEELLEAAPLPEAVVEEPDPEGALRHFYGRMLAIARGEPEIARIGLYSDSINGSDRMSRALREHFADRFGSAGKGWVPVSPGWQYQRHKNVEHRHEGWRVFVVNRGDREDGRYGLGGVLAANRRPRAWARWGTQGDGPVGDEVSVFRLYYQGFPGGGDVSLSLDGGAASTLSTDTAEVQDLVHEITAPEGSHELELRVEDGDVRLYGVVMEEDPPGVVVDGLMLVGAFTRVLLNFDREHWARQIEQRETDLLAFWLGGNDSVSDGVGFRPDEFVDDFAQVLEAAQAGRPEASCLVISVLDSAEEVDGRIRSRRRVPRVVEAQREAAERAGCAFFDGYEAIGGAGTMYRWAHASPRLVSVDYRHLTGEGATVFASLLYKAMLRGYDQWLAEGAPVE